MRTGVNTGIDVVGDPRPDYSREELRGMTMMNCGADGQGDLDGPLYNQSAEELDGRERQQYQ